jgi:hypothetical protein
VPDLERSRTVSRPEAVWGTSARQLTPKNAKGGGVIRILFVDDESNVIDAMRRSLYAMRDEWHMEFVLGGA